MSDRAGGGAASAEGIGSWVARVPRAASVSAAALSGLYAWAVTVGPIVWRSDAPLPAWEATSAWSGPLLLVGALVAEGGGARVVREVCLLGFVASAAATWFGAWGGSTQAIPGGGIAGTVAWLLFAFAWASPSSLRFTGNASARLSARRTAAATPPAIRASAWVAAGAVVAIVLVAAPTSGPALEGQVLWRVLDVALAVAVLAVCSALAGRARVRRPPSFRRR